MCWEGIGLFHGPVDICKAEIKQTFRDKVRKAELQIWYHSGFSVEDRPEWEGPKVADTSQEFHISLGTK